MPRRAPAVRFRGALSACGAAGVSSLVMRSWRSGGKGGAWWLALGALAVAACQDDGGVARDAGVAREANENLEGGGRGDGAGGDQAPVTDAAAAEALDGGSAEARDGAPAPALVMSSRPRELIGALLPEVATATADNRSFALRLYRALRAADPAGNLFFSPHSLSTALAMTHGGARGATANAMATTLQFTLTGPALHRAFNALDQELARRSSEAAGPGATGEAPRLTVANALWGKQGTSFTVEYLDLLATHYGAGLRPLDFAGNVDGSRLTINKWVEDQTSGRIKDLLMAGALRPDTMLVLTNAIYFKSSWAQPFLPSATSARPFHVAAGTTVQIPTMQRTGRMKYAETADVRAVELPYVGGKLAMVIVAPAEGRAAPFEASLSGPALDALLAGLAEREVLLRMPRFSVTGRFKLRDTLSALGMSVAFGPSADFSGITGAADVAISDVIHQSFVTVDEKGTEAAAATAVVAGPPSIPVVEVELNLDRPFLFGIRDVPTGALLFLGWVADPR